MSENSREELILFRCRCGKSYKAQGSLAGKIIVCKQCGERLSIPAAKTKVKSAPPVSPPPVNSPSSAGSGKAANHAAKSRALPTSRLRSAPRTRWIAVGLSFLVLVGILSGLCIFHALRVGAQEAAQSEYDGIMAEARIAVESERLPDAIEYLKRAASVPDAVNTAEATELIREAEMVLAQCDTIVQPMSDSELETFRKTPTIPAGQRFTNASLRAQYVVKLAAACEQEDVRRQEIKEQAARQAKEEADKVAQEDAEKKRKAEAEQQEVARAAAEAEEQNREEKQSVWHDAVAQAEKEVDARSERGVNYRISQAMEDRELCYKGRWVPNVGWVFDGDQFSLVGPAATSKTAADDQTFKDDLYWAGTFSYTTVRGVDRTVTEYALNKKDAIDRVIVKLDLLPKDFFAVEPPVSTPTPPTGSSGLGDVRDCGTGFAITEEGHIITNYHVVKDAKFVRVKTAKELLDAEVVASDPGNDLALLKVNARTDWASISSARVASLGQTVFTVGFPMPDIQGFSPKVTKGIVSGLKGIGDDVRTYQIDVSVQPGNSGGALADENGNVVGVVVARLSDAAVIRAEGVVPQNVNYALKLPYALALIDATPEIAKKIHFGSDGANVSFEEAVERVKRATVLIAAY